MLLPYHLYPHFLWNAMYTFNWSTFISELCTGFNVHCECFRFYEQS